MLTVELVGTGINLSLVVLPSTLDFGSVNINTTAKQSVTLINTSTAAVTGITAAVIGADKDLFTVDDAPTALGAGESATVDISYAPLATETRSQATVIFSGSDGEKASLTLYGEPVEVGLTVAPNPCDFGFVPLDRNPTAVCCVTVSNQANVPVDITGISEFGTEDDAFGVATTDDATPPNPQTFPTTPITVVGGASAKICFAFAPAITQQYSGDVTLVTNDPSGTNPIVQLTGWGGGPQISCAPTSLDFGPVASGNSSILPLTCTNTGSAIPATNLLLEAPTASPNVFGAQFDTTRDPYPLDGLMPGESAQIDVTYAPAAASDDTGTLLIRSNGGQGQTVQIPLTGQGK